MADFDDMLGEALAGERRRRSQEQSEEAARRAAAADARVRGDEAVAKAAVLGRDAARRLSEARVPALPVVTWDEQRGLGRDLLTRLGGNIDKHVRITYRKVGEVWPISPVPVTDTSSGWKSGRIFLDASGGFMTGSVGRVPEPGGYGWHPGMTRHEKYLVDPDLRDAQWGISGVEPIGSRASWPKDRGFGDSIAYGFDLDKRGAVVLGSRHVHREVDTWEGESDFLSILTQGVAELLVSRT